MSVKWNTTIQGRQYSSKHTATPQGQQGFLSRTSKKDRGLVVAFPVLLPIVEVDVWDSLERSVEEFWSGCNSIE